MQPGREAWTTAGIVRSSDIAYDIPFQLGGATLMITEEANPSRLDGDASSRSRFLIIDWRRVQPLTPKTPKDGLLVSYQWVCIGYLRAHDFIPVMPNFAVLLHVNFDHGHQRAFDYNPVVQDSVVITDGKVRGYETADLASVRRPATQTSRLAQSAQRTICAI